MKTEILNPPTLFRPREIKLTFESQKELDALGTLLNVSPVMDSIQSVFGEPAYDALTALREVIGDAGGDVSLLHNDLRDRIHNFSK